TGVCLNVNPARPGAAYGYVDMGGWIGGQAEYVMVPYADFNLLKFPDRDQALEKIMDLTMLSDIFPTGYHGAYTAGVTTGSTVYVAGAGPVGLAAAHAAQVLGAAVVVVGDMNADRLRQAETFGCETVDLSSGNKLPDMLEEILGDPEVDASVDAVGFEARGHGPDAEEEPATVLNDIIGATRVGAGLGIPGRYVTGEPGAADEGARVGRIGDTEARAHAGGAHDVVEHRRGFLLGVRSVPAGFETDGVDGGVHLGVTEDLLEHVGELVPTREINGFATEGLRLAQPVGIHISDDDDGGPEHLGGVCGR